jgi:hypothetical protein
MAMAAIWDIATAACDIAAAAGHGDGGDMGHRQGDMG